MPVYVYKCDTHGEVERYAAMGDSGVSVLCPVCHTEMQRSYTSEAAGLPPFRSYWTEALTPGSQPIRIDSRAQERRLCKNLDVERVS